MRTGSCKYGVTCKFHHPPPTVALPMSSSIYAGGTSMPAPQPYAGALPTWSLARPPYISSPRLQGPSSYGAMLLPAQGIVSMPGWSTYQVRISQCRDLSRASTLKYRTLYLVQTYLFHTHLQCCYCLCVFALIVYYEVLNIMSST
jgi:hypothetical protein